MPPPKFSRLAAVSFVAVAAIVLNGAQTPYFVPIPSQGGGVIVSDPTIRPMQEPGSAASIFTSRPVDLRGIGRPDMILCYGIVPPAPAAKMPIRILRPQPDGSLADITRQLLGDGPLPGAVAPRVIVEGDFNEDGRVDIFVACQGWDANPFPGEVNVLLLSNPDGTYSDASANLPQTPDFTHDSAVGDVNGDDHLDIYVGNISGQQSVGPYLLLGNGDGTFTKVTSGLPATITSTTEKFTACGLVDIDGDGASDLVLGTHGDGGFLDSIVLFNDGTGNFTVRPRLVLPDGPLGRGNTVVQGIGVHDINRDGWPDLIVTSSQYSTFSGMGIQILINRGNGTVADESVARLGSHAARFNGSPYPAPTLADLNGDGLMDFYFHNGPAEQVPRMFVARLDGGFEPVPTSGPDAAPLGFGFGVHVVPFDADGLGDLVQATHTTEGDVRYQTFFNRTVVPPTQATFVAIGASPLKAPATADFVPSNALTIEGWIHVTSVAAGYSFLMGKPLDANVDPVHSFNLQLAPGNRIVFAQSDGVAGHLAFPVTIDSIPAGEWTHIAATVDPTGVRIYINGVLDTTVPSFLPFKPEAAVPFSIGLGFRSNADPYHNPFPGLARDVRFWNVARTQAQIAASMNTTLPADQSGLVAAWPLDEASGTVARDVSGHDRHLTAAGGIVSMRNAVVSHGPFFETTRTDVTDESLRYVNPKGAKIDVDRDGKWELIEVQGFAPSTYPGPLRPARLYRLINGAFTEVTGTVMGNVELEAPARTLVADFNGDNWSDALLVGSGTDIMPLPGEQAKLLLNDGLGHLVDRTATHMPQHNDYAHDATTGDIDGDGDLDLFISNLNGGDGGCRVYVNDGAGKFTEVTGRLPANIEDRTLSFTGCLLVDLTGDGRCELLLGGWPPNVPAGINELLLNNGSGTFVRPGSPLLPPRMFGSDGTVLFFVAGDLNQDGRTDLLLSCTRYYAESGLQVLLQQVDGTFVDATAASGITWSAGTLEIDRVDLVDFNNDGRPDLATHFAAPGGHFTRLFLNFGDARFIEATDTFTRSPVGVSFHAGDLNGDGIIDLADTQSSGVSFHRGLSRIDFLPFVDPPAITTQPVDQAVLTGGSATFTASASGTPSLTYQWQKNGKNIPGANAGSLTIPSVTVNDLGLYRFIATNDYGTAASHVATLAIAAAPAITSHPTSQTILGGSQVTFSVIATGAPAPTFQWKFNGADIPGATSSFYTINSVVPANAGLYSVSVSNSQGTEVSNAATLTVHVLPAFTLFPGNVTHNAGTAINWSASATGVPTPTLQWRKNGVDIPGATGTTLSIPSVSLSDAGTYSIVASNAAGNLESPSWTLTVNDPPVAPSITTHPASQTVTAGQPASFTVVATGTPEPSYQWRKGGVNIGGATSATYNIAATVAGDAGSYDCVVTNSAGNATSNAATLTVDVPPSITSHPANKTAVIGSDVTFTVTASGTAPFTYQWKRNGSNVGTNSPTLTVTDVQPGAGATYTVVVTNSAGSVTSNPATLALDATPRLINVSCLASSGSGDSTLVAGFYINGAGSKTLLIRGIGPRLTSDPFNRTGVVADPQIRVYDKDGVLIASNDNWDPILAADFSRMGAFGLTNGSLDAALKVVLPGNDRYTVHLVNNGTVADGLIEVYDFSRDNATRLSNVSCRLDLKAGETVILGTSLIANPVPVLARAIGPGLADYGIPLADTLPDPDVRVYAGSTEIAFNEDWSNSVQPYFGPAGAFPLTAGSKDAVARITFTQGGLTIHATGKGQTGIAIIELFESPEPP